MTIEMVVDRLTYRRNGFVYMKPCLDIIFYWSGSLFDRVDGVLACYQKCVEVLEGRFKYYRTETMSAARPLRHDTLDLLPFWLRGTKSRRDVYMLFLENGSAPDEPSDRAFALNATPARGYIQLILPATVIANSVTRYLELARTLGQMMPYDFGQAGFATHWNYLGRNHKGVLSAMNALAPRFPGLDMSYPLCTKYIVPKGIKCANWLTFLNAEDCRRLVGVPALKERFESPIVVHDVRDGVMIQAGPSPAIGDVNRQDVLPLYHQVGRQLAPVRFKDHPPLFGPRGVADKEITEKWLGRFDS
jgi:hypothetical protein